VYNPVYALASLDSTRFASVSIGFAKGGLVSGDNLNFVGNSIQFNGGSTSDVSADGLDSEFFVVAYKEEGVGMCVVLSASDFNSDAGDDTTVDDVNDEGSDDASGDDERSGDDAEEGSNSRLNLSGIFSLFKNRKTGFIEQIRQLLALLFASWS
jgi:hypothetical protein